ncbi:MAG: hypothetical protein Ct9H90mP24_5740 [Methanobacteriota archaeon]|nr:MAG: hypothetical protein Ct9H90mP24_5740 [Euryarchaeota archaeon]
MNSYQTMWKILFLPPSLNLEHLGRMFIEAVSFVEDKSKVPTKAGQGGGSKLSGSNSIVTCPIYAPGGPMVDGESRQAWRFIEWITRPMETGEIGFLPSGVARGDDVHVLTGTKVKWLKSIEGHALAPQFPISIPRR